MAILNPKITKRPKGYRFGQLWRVSVGNRIVSGHRTKPAAQKVVKKMLDNRKRTGGFYR